MDDALTAQRWDAEYGAGRYGGDPPLPFVGRIVETLGQFPDLRAGRGLYVGCGNGRNFVPLAEAGLDLTGLDVSPVALSQLAARLPRVRDKLICAALDDYTPGESFAYVVAIQVFQHGAERDTVAQFRKAAALLRPGGLLFLRVNSAATNVEHAHTLIERNAWGGFTVRYDAGPKRGMPIHFFTEAELRARLGAEFEWVGEWEHPVTARAAPQTGAWAQWEVVCRRRE